MKKNSAYFIGSIVSITGIYSTAQFENCNFNNNNGIQGGLFYVSRRSSITVINSSIFNNFSVLAPVAYIGSNGSIKIYNCDLSRNIAVTVGLIETVDTIEESLISNSTIISNSLVDKSIILEELDDSSICINL